MLLPALLISATFFLSCLIESLLSLKKSRLLQLLDNEEEIISDFPGSMNESTCSNEQENESVSCQYLSDPTCC